MSTPLAKRIESAAIADHVAEFLARGKKINVREYGETAFPEGRQFTARQFSIKAKPVANPTPTVNEGTLHECEEQREPHANVEAMLTNIDSDFDDSLEDIY